MVVFYEHKLLENDVIAFFDCVAYFKIPINAIYDEFVPMKLIYTNALIPLLFQLFKNFFT